MRTPTQRRKGQNDIQLARGRFRNVLNDTLGGSDDDGDATEEDLPHRGRPPKNINKLQREMSPRSSRNSSLSPGKYLTPTKRRKREQQTSGGIGEDNVGTSIHPTQKIQAESFIMKLFDRSLDLSKYTEQTALYPICRAWMSNQPRNPNIRSYRERRSPSPVERNNNASEMLQKLKSSEIREMRAMPASQPTNFPKIPILNHEIPSAKKIDVEIFDKGGLELNTSKDDLLGMHLNKWRELKSDWLKQNRNYQKRYETNYLILQELFKP